MSAQEEYSEESLHLYARYHVTLSVITSAVSVVLLALNTVTLIGIRSCKKCFRYPAFRIMCLSIGFDTVQLVVHLTSAIFGACGQLIPFSLNTALGAIISAAWMTSNGLTVLLSFHRVLVVAHPIMERKIFDAWKEHALLVLFSMIFPIYAAFQFSPYSRFLFYYIDLEWNYDFCLPYSRIFLEIDHGSIIVLLVFFILCYARIFYKILTQNSGNSFEWKLTINVFIYGLYFAFVFIYWEFIDGTVFESNPVSNFISNMIWVVANGIQAIITLILNRAVRKAGAKMVLSWIVGVVEGQPARAKSRFSSNKKEQNVAPYSATMVMRKANTRFVQ